MKFKKRWLAVLTAAVAVLFLTGPVSAMGKKEPVQKEKELGQGGTMTKSYDPETGVKRMEKTTGQGDKEMTLEKEPHSGAQIERSWSTGPEAGGASKGQGQGKNK
jgi:hypothetical protein